LSFALGDGRPNCGAGACRRQGYVSVIADFASYLPYFVCYQPHTAVPAVETVRIKREKMGLRNSELRAWTPEELSELGGATDTKVAERIGRTLSAVAHKRITLGIPPARRRDRA
jgi:hypothetical protein